MIKKYLYYVLPKIDYNSNRATKGNTLNTDTVGDLEIPFEYEKAKEIVAQLDAIETKRQRKISEKIDLENEKDLLISSKVFLK